MTIGHAWFQIYGKKVNIINKWKLTSDEDEDEADRVVDVELKLWTLK